MVRISMYGVWDLGFGRFAIGIERIGFMLSPAFLIRMQRGRTQGRAAHKCLVLLSVELSVCLAALPAFALSFLGFCL